jgi:dTDP-4-dehydrorhamnose reductase
VKQHNAIELWGGVECTVNRVGDRFFDQVELSGHGDRLDDLDILAELGVRAVRYPILWERTVRAGLDDFDFSWADARMKRLRELGIRVIAGLVHHGSGPHGTSLLQENFVQGLGKFAAAIAARYPWIEDYTPVNEPLTTARFSALYGHWYPHRRQASAFVRALLIQTRATRAAMTAIRAITPSARLLQTEDFGSIFGTPALEYQVSFENQRKWLSLDLLFGRVRRTHPLYRYLLGEGASARELDDLATRPCRPDCVGVNYYVTSDRFLDDRIAHYPQALWGSNGRHRYVDVEAVRAHPAGIVGHREVLLSCWARYGAPLAITEVHLGCTPDEQIRWLHEAWKGAHAARDEGANVGAVTVWSLFGSYDWDSLVTKSRGHYEPGVFDVSAGTPRRTPLTNFVERLARPEVLRDPSLQGWGWWRATERFFPHAHPLAESLRQSQFVASLPEPA